MKFEIKLTRKGKPEPYWHSLLRYYERKGYISNGLTIPYIIGARSIIEPDMPLLSISELVQEVVEYGGTLLKCPYLNEFVLGSLDTETMQMAYCYTKLQNLVIPDDSLEKKQSTEEAILFFESLYASPVSNYTYSKVDGHWGGFTKMDLEHLQNCSAAMK